MCENRERISLERVLDAGFKFIVDVLSEDLVAVKVQVFEDPDIHGIVLVELSRNDGYVVICDAKRWVTLFTVWPLSFKPAGEFQRLCVCNLADAAIGRYWKFVDLR